LIEQLHGPDYRAAEKIAEAMLIADDAEPEQPADASQEAAEKK